jgi:hypothetical protein
MALRLARETLIELLRLGLPHPPRPDLNEYGMSDKSMGETPGH